MSEWIEKHIACLDPQCGSSDAMSINENGWGHCFACGGNFPPKGSKETKVTKTASKNEVPMITGDVVALRERKITEETCRKWGYEVGRFNGRWCHIANYRDDTGTKVSQKLRFQDKDFAITGNAKHMPLYGQWLWRSAGKYICITEGEIDALSMSQVMDNEWPVVSLPNGAQSAAKDVARNAEWLNKFGSVVLCFDMDGPGRDAVEAVTKVLPPGKVKVMNLPEKDANEVLVKRGTKELLQAFWNAKDWRPDGIISGKELTRERLKKAIAQGYLIGLPAFDEKTFGIRKGEINMLTAGSGIGKSTWAREIAYTLHQQYGLSIGNVLLEENNDKSGQAYVAIHSNVSLKNIRRDPTILPDELWDKALAEVVHERMYFYDHFGSLDSKNLISKLRYLATVDKVDFIVLDHISIVVSGVSSDEGERKDIDMLMTSLASLAEETGVGIIAIVHLKRKQKGSFNEGAQVSLTDLRGSGSLEQLSHNVYALERDQQGENETQALIRILKCRETGETGEADTLDYNRTTGRLLLASGFDPVTGDGVPETF